MLTIDWVCVQYTWYKMAWLHEAYHWQVLPHFTYICPDSVAARGLPLVGFLHLTSNVFLQIVWLHEAYHWLVRAQRAKARYHKGEKEKREQKEAGDSRVKEWLDKKQD